MSIYIWGRIYPKEVLDQVGRVVPEEWANYAFASTKRRSPLALVEEIEANSQTSRRNTQSKHFDTLRKRVGHQAFFIIF